VQTIAARLEQTTQVGQYALDDFGGPQSLKTAQPAGHCHPAAAAGSWSAPPKRRNQRDRRVSRHL